MKLPFLTARYEVTGLNHQHPYREGRTLNTFTERGAIAARNRLLDAGFLYTRVRERSLRERLRFMDAGTRRYFKHRRNLEENQ